MSYQFYSKHSFVVCESVPSRLEGGWVFPEQAEDRLNGTIIRICEDVLFLGLSQTTTALRADIEKRHHTFAVVLDASSSVSAVRIDDLGEVQACRIEVSCNEVYQLAAEHGCSVWTAAANVAAIYVEDLLVALAREFVTGRVPEEGMAMVEAELKPRTRSNILKALCSNNFTESHLERRHDDYCSDYPAAF